MLAIIITSNFRCFCSATPSASHIYPYGDHYISVYKYEKFFKDMTLLPQDLQLAPGTVLLSVFLDIMW